MELIGSFIALSRWMEKSVQLAALRRQVAPPAFTDFCALMIGLVGQLAARWPQVALPRRVSMDWALPMTGLVAQLATHRLQVPSLGAYRWIGH